MAILRVNNCGDPTGTVDPITLSNNVVTTCTWPSAPLNMPTVASPNILKLSVEPSTPNEEILYVTAYTSGATSATVTRAAEGPGVARTHAATPWVHGPTAADFTYANVIGNSDGNSPAVVNGVYNVLTADVVTLTPGNWLVLCTLGIQIPASTSGYGQALITTTTSTSTFTWASSAGLPAQIITAWDSFVAGSQALNKAFFAQATIGVNVSTPIYPCLYFGLYSGGGCTFTGGFNTFQHGLTAIYLGPL